MTRCRASILVEPTAKSEPAMYCMYLNAKRVLCVGTVLLLLVSISSAGPLPTDPNAIPGWQGTATFTGTTGGFTLKAEVDYAVYAPATLSPLFNFDNSAALGGPAAFDPSAGTQYVYAYEINNDPTGTAIALNLSVGLLSGSVITSSANIDDDPVSPDGGLAPTLDQFIPTSNNPKTNAKWSWTSNFPTPGQHSDILIFTSPYGPTMFNAAMQGGQTTIAPGTLPSPLPEPTSMALFGIGLTSIAAARFIRRRRG